MSDKRRSSIFGIIKRKSGAGKEASGREATGGADRSVNARNMDPDGPKLSPPPRFLRGIEGREWPVFTGGREGGRGGGREGKAHDEG